MNYNEHKEEIINLKKQGLGSRKIAKHFEDKGFEVSDNVIRQVLRRWGYGANTFEKKLDENNFEKDNWSYGWLKTKEGSIFIKNKEGLVTFEQMRQNFLEDLEKYSPTFDKLERKKSYEKHALIIDIADLHLGKLGMKSETGDAYDVQTAIDRALEGVQGILDKSVGFAVEKIVFIIGNDVLHVDNANNTTTKGTAQDVSGIWFENYKTARQLYTHIIERLVSLADVHIVHCPSNHDYVTGYMLADTIYCCFKNHPNITFDVTNAYRKYYKYGKNLLGFSHGDGGKMDTLPLVMANEAKQDWADTDWRYIFLHHLHHKKQFITMSGKDYHGVNIEYLRSPSGTDSWHHKHQYQHAHKAIEAFVHHKEKGQVARLTHLFL